MKLREIERLRALAVLLTLFHHWDSAHLFLHEYFYDGSWTGVDLFFVISGYVVSRSIFKLFPPLDAAPTFSSALERTRPFLKAFYARRFYRILPAAFTVALLHGIIGHFAPDTFGATTEWVREFIAFLATFYDYTKPVVGYSQLGPYWSLSVEEHFYLILPLLLVIFRTKDRRLAACGGIMMFSIIARTMSHPDVGVACVAQYERMCSHLRFDSLMAGVVLALIQNKATSAPVLPVRFVRWLLVPGVIVLLWVLPVAGNDYVVDRVGLILIWGVAAILVGYASLDRGYVLEVPVLRRVLEYMGSRSYALYLVHDDISRLETMARNRWHLYARLVPWREHDTRPFLVMFLGSLLAAELLHRIIEKPLMRVGARRIGAFLKGEAGGGAPEGVAAVS